MAEPPADGRDQGAEPGQVLQRRQALRLGRVKQSPGWKVTQPRPGWHEWTTPSDRTYTQGPKQYPV